MPADDKKDGAPESAKKEEFMSDPPFDRQGRPIKPKPKAPKKPKK